MGHSTRKKMSKPRPRSERITKRDQLAKEMREIATFEEIKKRFNAEEPFASGFTDSRSFGRWVTFTLNFSHNTFSPSSQFLQSTGQKHTGYYIKMPELFKWVRNETAVCGAYSPETAFEWNDNMERIANAFDPNNEYDTLNVFVCEQEKYQRCFISSPVINNRLQKRLEDGEGVDFEVRLTIGGGDYDFYVNNPHLCGFPFAERNYGPAEEIEAHCLPIN